MHIVVARSGGGKTERGIACGSNRTVKRTSADGGITATAAADLICASRHKIAQQAVFTSWIIASGDCDWKIV